MSQDQFKAKLKANESFVLTNDLTLEISDLPTLFTLEEWESVESYSGTLDGNNKKITIKSFKSGSVGLLNKLGAGGKIKDLTLELDTELQLSNKNGGVLAAYNSGLIERVKIIGSGKIIHSREQGAIGGLVGKNEAAGRIKQSSSSVGLEGEVPAGGLVGENEGGIEESYSTGDVVGMTWIGGFVGVNKGDIKNSYSTGSVRGKGAYQRVGGFVGYIRGVIENCYSRAENVEGAGVDVAVGRFAGEIEGVSSETGVDYSNKLKNNFVMEISSPTKDIGIGSSSVLRALKTEEIRATTFSSKGWSDAVWIFGPKKWPEFVWQSGVGSPGVGDGPIKPKEMTQKEFREKLVAHESFALTNDLTLENWEMVLEYRGKLDGKDKKLIIKSFKGADARGLIKEIGEGGGVKDLNIELKEDVTFEADPDARSPNLDAAGLLAAFNKGKVEGIKVLGSGKVNRVKKNVWNTTTGGLIGKNEKTGHVKGSSSELVVEGKDFVGGLVGWNDGGTIEGSHAEGDVEGKVFVGGLVGRNGGKIEGSHAEGDVEGRNYVGGLVGDNGGGTITNSYAEGDVTGEDFVGGLVGGNWDKGTITNSYAEGDVTGEDYVGGLVGGNWDKGTITNSYATGAVTGTGSHVGGLVGGNWDKGTITNSYATGAVKGVDDVGGLVGWNGGKIEGSHANTDIRYPDGDGINVGGFIGSQENGTITKCSSAGKLTRGDTTTTTKGNNPPNLGGFIGKLSGSGTIEESFSTTDINFQSGNINVGGFIGRQGAGTIENAYSAGELVSKSFAAGGNTYVGGFIGQQTDRGEIKSVYTRSTIDLGDGVRATAGHFAGKAFGTIDKSYYINTDLKVTVGSPNTANWRGKLFLVGVYNDKPQPYIWVNLDKKIWNITEGEWPTFKWQP